MSAMISIIQMMRNGLRGTIRMLKLYSRDFREPMKVQS